MTFVPCPTNSPTSSLPLPSPALLTSPHLSSTLFCDVEDTTSTCTGGQEAVTTPVTQCEPGSALGSSESCSCGQSSLQTALLNESHDTHPGRVTDVIFSTETRKSCCHLCGEYLGARSVPGGQFAGFFLQGEGTNWCGAEGPGESNMPMVPSGSSTLDSDPENVAMVCVCVTEDGPFCPHCVAPTSTTQRSSTTTTTPAATSSIIPTAVTTTSIKTTPAPTTSGSTDTTGMSRGGREGSTSTSRRASKMGSERRLKAKRDTDGGGGETFRV